MGGRILVLDDEEKMARLIARSLERSGYEAVACCSPTEALGLLKAESFDVLLTDLRMPDHDGLEVLRRAKAIDPGIDVILMTAYASVDTVRQAMKLGAADYLEKPVSTEDDLKPLLERLLGAGETREVKAPATRQAPTPAPSAAGTPNADFPGIQCRSAAMQEVYSKALRVARSNASVLLRGESGTGKEVVADIIRLNSPRRERAFVRVNCGALTETLLESELFGHVRGSFTGALADRDGLFVAADGGTILLDEIGEVSPALQVKLLRVLQQGELTPVGGTRPLKVDVRVIAATNRPLERMVESGEFRQDLYYRLNVVPLELPPLRQRKEDIPELVAFFVRRYSPSGRATFLPEADHALMEYDWPGNIRELENAVEHAMVLGDPAGVRLADLPMAVQECRSQLSSGGTAPNGAPPAMGDSSLEEMEKRCLLQALEKTHGNRTRAAQLLNITRRTLGYRLRKYGLEDQIQSRYTSS